MRVIRYFLIFCIIILLSCTNSNPNFFLGENPKCEPLDSSVFFERINKHWPTLKPNSIADAVKLLDGMADKNFKCGIIQISDENLYFTLGLKIRNDWVRHGTDSIKNQFFHKLRLSNVDYSSGLIIDIYRQLLTNKKVDLIERYSKETKDSSWQTTRHELMKIQKELGY
jgi:hypothetical protein